MEYDIWYERLYKNNSKVSFPGVLLNAVVIAYVHLTNKHTI